MFRSASSASADAVLQFNISLPSGAAVGDELRAMVISSGGTTVWNTPTGWELVESATVVTPATGPHSTALFRKTVASGDGPFTFSIQGATTQSMAGGIACYTAEGTTATDVHANNDDADANGTVITAPSVTPTTPASLVVRAFTAGATTITADSAPIEGRLRFDVAATSAVRRLHFCDEDHSGAVATGTETATAAASTGHVGITAAFSVTPSESMVPVAGGSVSNLSTYTATAIDEDPDASAGDWLTGTDPSGSTGSSNDQYANAQTTASGFANQLTNPANAVGSSEATTSATTGATQNADYANFFTFDSTALAAAIPSNATITGFTVRLRDALSTLSRGDVAIRVDSANGTQIAGEDIAKTGLGTSLPAAGTGAHTATPITLPTRAQIVASTFGVRVRYRRTASQAATYTLDWLRLEISYSVPGSTVNTQVDAPMSDPTAALATGTATGTVKALVRKLGSGSNPSARVELRTAGGTLLATPIADTAVSSTSGTVLSGTFDQSAVGAGTDVVARVVGTGAAGGLIEVGAIRWIGQNTTTATVGNTRGISYDVRALAGNTRQALFNVSGLTGNTRVLSFNISGRAGVSRQILYDLRAPAGNTRAILYNVGGYAGNTRAILYNVLTKAGNTRQILYDLRSLAGSPRQILYDLRAPVGNTRQVLYNVSSLTGNTRALLFNILTTIGNSRVISYDLRALSGNTRQIRFDISGRSGNTRSILYNVSALSGNQRTILYDVLVQAGLAGSSRQIRYDVRALAGNTRQALFNISGRSGNTRVIAYDLRGLAPSSRQVLYDVRGLTGNSRAVRYDLAALTGNTRQVRYDVRALSGNSRTIRYDVLGIVVAGNTRDLIYNGNTLTGNTRQIRFDISGRTGNTRQIRYDLRALAGSPRQVLYDVRGYAGNNRVIAYDVYQLAAALRQIRYGVNTLAGSSRTILFDVESIAVEVYLMQIAILHAAELEGIAIQPADLETAIAAAAELDAEAIAAGALAPAVIKGSRLEPETWAIG